MKQAVDNSDDVEVRKGFINDQGDRYSLMRALGTPGIEVFFSKYTETEPGMGTFTRIIHEVRGVIYKLNKQGIVQEELFIPVLVWNDKGHAELCTTDVFLISDALVIARMENLSLRNLGAQ